MKVSLQRDMEGTNILPHPWLSERDISVYQQEWPRVITLKRFEYFALIKKIQRYIYINKGFVTCFYLFSTISKAPTLNWLKGFLNRSRERTLQRLVWMSPAWRWFERQKDDVHCSQSTQPLLSPLQHPVVLQISVGDVIDATDSWLYI